MQQYTQLDKTVGSCETTQYAPHLCPILCIRLVIHVLAFVFCRIVFSSRGKMIPLSVLFIKATFNSNALTAVSDGSSPSMALSAAVHCLLKSFGGCLILTNIPTNLEQ